MPYRYMYYIYTRLMPSFKLEYILDQLQLGQTTGISNPSRTIPGSSPKLMLAYGAPSGRSTFRRNP
jgi:hypothetical protein